MTPPPATSAPRLAIIIPCLNEAAVLPETARRLDALLKSLINAKRLAADSYACFVDDGSTDQTWSLIRALHESSPRFAGLKLSRNRGHQNALMAGLLNATGDLVISMDADLQDDTNAIEAMLDATQAGADIVYGVRSARPTDTHFKRTLARFYYRLLGWMGVEVVFDHADFRLLTRRAVEALREYQEANIFLRALIPQLGFETSIVPYERSARFAGTSKYSLRKMLSLAIEGITSFSTRPLRIVTALGLVTSIISVGLMFWAMSATLVFHHVIPGWASTVIPIYLVCGVQLLSLGIIGEYVGKIYLETKRRPRFLIAQSLTPPPHDLASAANQKPTLPK